jgi:hypothetical protein
MGVGGGRDLLYEFIWARVSTNDETIDKDKIDIWSIDLITTEHGDIFHTKIVADGLDVLLVVRRHVSQEREILDEPTGFALWSVSRTHHSPLRGLQGTRTGDLPSLLELMTRKPRERNGEAGKRARRATCEATRVIIPNAEM